MLISKYIFTHKEFALAEAARGFKIPFDSHIQIKWASHPLMWVYIVKPFVYVCHCFLLHCIDGTVFFFCQILIPQVKLMEDH